MRRFAILLTFSFCFCGSTLAQRTIVTGVVQDTSGLPYSGATLTATLVTPLGTLGAYLGGAQIAGTAGPTSLDAAGSFLMQLPDNTLIQCANAIGQIVSCTPQTKWTFTITITGVAPPVGTGPQTCTQTLTISGTTQTFNPGGCPALTRAGIGGPAGNVISPATLIGSSSCNNSVPGHSGNCYFLYQDAIIWVGCTWPAGGPPTTVTCQSTSPLCPPACASVTSNIATITFLNAQGFPIFNPIQANWQAGHTIVVSQFSGADTFYNGTFTISTLTATSVSYPLVHANAGSTTNGLIVNQNVGPFKPTDCQTGAGCTGINTKTGFGTSTCPNTNPPACIASIPEGNIASFISPTQATINTAAANAGVTVAQTTSFQYGTDDTANLFAIANALKIIAGFDTGVPASVAIGCGTSIVQKFPFIFGGQNRMPFDVHGCGGEATAFVMRQDFDYTGCGQNGGCIFEDDNSASGNLTPIGLTDYFHDFLFYGGGYDCNGCNLGGKSGLYVSYAHHVENVTVQGWNHSSATTLAQRFIGIVNAGGRVVNSHAYAAGFVQCQSVIGPSSGLFSIWDRVICAPNFGTGMDVESGQTFLVSTNLEAGSSGIQSGAISQFGGKIISGGGNFLLGKAIIVQGEVHLNGDTFTAGGSLLCGYNSSPAPLCYIKDTVNSAAPQVPTAGTTGPAILIDQCGNTWTGIPQVTTGTYIPCSPFPQGSCTGISTASIGSPGIFVQPATAATRTCTSTTEVAIFQVPRTGTLQLLQCTATTGGVNASSGLVTVRVAPLTTGTFAASGITATFGTTASAIDITHSFAVTAGQFVSIAYTTQNAETLAGVSCNVVLQ